VSSPCLESAGPVPGAVDPAEDELQAYFERENLLQQATAALMAGRYGQAIPILEQLFQKNPDHSAGRSSLIYAKAMDSGERAARIQASADLSAQQQASPFCVTTLLWSARLHVVLEKPSSAIRCLQRALEIEPERVDIKVELRQVEQGASAAPDSTDKRSPMVQISDLTADGLDLPKLATVLGAWLAVSFVIFALENIAGLGEDAHFYDLDGNLLPVVRVILLLGAGVGLSYVLLGDEQVEPRQFIPVPVWSLVAIVVGVVIGLLSAQPLISAPLAVGILLGAAHAVSEEAFFRFFLARGLRACVPGATLPTLLGAACYGIYGITLFQVWVLAGPAFGSAVGLMALGVGIPFFWLYYRTGSFAVPFLGHLALRITLVAGATIYF
jgi:hypothetical protein